MTVETIDVKVEIVEKDPTVTIVAAVFTPDGNIIVGKRSDERVGLAIQRVTENFTPKVLYEVSEGAISECIQNTYGFNVPNWTPVKTMVRQDEDGCCEMIFIVTAEYDGDISKYLVWTRKKCIEEFKGIPEIQNLTDIVFQIYEKSWIPN